MNSVLKAKIIEAIRDPRNQALESGISSTGTFFFARDTVLLDKSGEQIMRLDECANIDYARLLLKIHGRTVFDITVKRGEDGADINYNDEWQIVLELRQAVNYHRSLNDNLNNKTPLTPQEKSIIDFLQQKQR